MIFDVHKNPLPTVIVSRKPDGLEYVSFVTNAPEIKGKQNFANVSTLGALEHVYRGGAENLARITKTVTMRKAPTCTCGQPMELVTGSTIYKHNIFCDTCDGQVPNESKLWHCQKDHLGYDVCTSCFPVTNSGMFQCCFCKADFPERQNFRRHMLDKSVLCKEILRPLIADEWNIAFQYCKPPGYDFYKLYIQHNRKLCEKRVGKKRRNGQPYDELIFRKKLKKNEPHDCILCGYYFASRKQLKAHFLRRKIAGKSHELCRRLKKPLKSMEWDVIRNHHRDSTYPVPYLWHLIQDASNS